MILSHSFPSCRRRRPVLVSFFCSFFRGPAHIKKSKTTASKYARNERGMHCDDFCSQYFSLAVHIVLWLLAAAQINLWCSNKIFKFIFSHSIDIILESQRRKPLRLQRRKEMYQKRVLIQRKRFEWCHSKIELYSITRVYDSIKVMEMKWKWENPKEKLFHCVIAFSKCFCPRYVYVRDTSWSQTQFMFACQRENNCHTVLHCIALKCNCNVR